METEKRGNNDGGSGAERVTDGRREKQWQTEKKMEKRECSREGKEVVRGTEGRVNSAPNRQLGHSEPGTETTPPYPLPTARQGQLSYAVLTASVCCVLWVCLDSPALLRQQLNNRWLKKASIQSSLDQKITPRKVHKLQTKTHGHNVSTHMQMTWLVSCVNKELLAANSYFIATKHTQRHNEKTYTAVHETGTHRDV